MEQLINTKSREELVEMVYAQRVHIAKVEADLEKEREQIQAIVDNVLPIAQEIKEAKGLFKVFKIAKLAVVIVEYFIEWAKPKNKETNG